MLRRLILFAVTAAVLTVTSGTSGARAQRVDPLGDLKAQVAQGRLDPSVLDAAQQRGSVDAILTLDDTAALRQIRARAAVRGLAADDAQALADKAAAYRSLKQAALAGVTGVTVRQDYQHFPVQFVHIDSLAALRNLLAQPNVSGVRENTANKPALAESLPLIHQPQAYASGFTGAGTSVAVLDTGVDYTRAAFGSCSSPGVPASCKVAYSADIAPDDGSLDDNGHGTNVSGIVVGVAPDAKVLSLDVFTAVSGGLTAYNADIISGLNWVVSNKAAYNIVAANMSFSSKAYYTSTCTGSAFATVFANVRAAGVLPVVAAGDEASTNDSDPIGGFTSGIGSPACTAGAISVGAVYDGGADIINGAAWGNPQNCADASGAANTITCFSQSGPNLSVLAPGAMITAAGITAGGTSQAAPHVAGAIAALASRCTASPITQIESAIENNGPSIDDKRGTTTITKHRLDVQAAGVALCGTPSAPANSGTITINDSTSPPTIAAPYPSTISVSGLTGTISKLTVTLNGIHHGYINDVDVLLAGPTGQNLVLMGRAAQTSNARSPLTLVFDDSASGPLPQIGDWSGGTYKPSNYGAGDTYPSPAPAPSSQTALAAFNNTSPNGTWSLYVVDQSAFDSGAIDNGWSLSFTLSAPSPDFGLSCNPSALTATAGGPSVSSTCTVTSIAGFTSAVDLGCTGLPAQTGCLFNPASVTPPANGSGTSTLTFSANAGAATGANQPFQVAGSSGLSLSHSTPMTATINAPSGTPPNAPSNLRVNGTITGTSIPLAWNDNATDETSFQLASIWSSPGAAWAYQTLGAGVTTATLSPLLPANRYYAYVRACNAAGCSSWSNVSGGATPGSAPAPPTTFHSTAASYSGVDMSWTNAATNAALVQIGHVISTSTIFAWESLPPTATTFTLAPVVPGGVYYLYVRACNAAGCSAYAAFGIHAGTAPPTPVWSVPGGGLTVTGSGTTVTLNWTDVSGETTYQLGYAEAGVPVITWSTPPADATSAALSGLVTGVTYYGFLRACNPSGCSTYAPTLTITMVGGPPGPGPAPSSGRAPVDGVVPSAPVDAPLPPDVVAPLPVGTGTAAQAGRGASDTRGLAVDAASGPKPDAGLPPELSGNAPPPPAPANGPLPSAPGASTAPPRRGPTPTGTPPTPAPSTVGGSDATATPTARRG